MTHQSPGLNSDSGIIFLKIKYSVDCEAHFADESDETLETWVPNSESGLSGHWD